MEGSSQTLSPADLSALVERSVAEAETRLRAELEEAQWRIDELEEFYLHHDDGGLGSRVAGWGRGLRVGMWELACTWTHLPNRFILPV